MRRGEIKLDFLIGKGEDTEFLRDVYQQRKKYINPFNWVLVRRDEEGFHTWMTGSLTSGSSVEVNIDLEDVFI